MAAAEVKKLNDVEEENQRLKRAVANHTLDNLILKATISRAPFFADG